MKRADRIREAAEECQRALVLDSNFDVEHFLRLHPNLLPELRDVLEKLQRSRRSFQAEGTIVRRDGPRTSLRPAHGKTEEVTEVPLQGLPTHRPQRPLQGELGEVVVGHDPEVLPLGL